MEGIREIIPCEVKLPKKTSRKPLISTHVGYSTVIESSITPRSCDVLVVADFNKQFYEASHNKHVWCLLSPEFKIQKSVGCGDAVISTSKPQFQEQKCTFPQACCWRSPGELLILCRALSSFSDETVSKRSENFEIYLERCGETLNLSDAQSTLLATTVIELDLNESINSMFYVPHRMETVVDNLSREDGTKDAARKSEVPCMLVTLLSTHGKFYFWKISDVSELRTAQPVEPDGTQLVMSLFDNMPDSRRIVSCAQTSSNSIVLLTETHLALLTLDARSSVQLRAMRLESSPNTLLPVSLTPSIRNSSANPLTVRTMAEFAYFPKDEDKTTIKFVSGWLNDDCVLKTHVLSLTSDLALIAGFSVQPFSDTKKVVIITESELAVYCCRFDGLKIFSMKLDRAIGAVWIPSISVKHLTLCIWSLGGKDSITPICCDFVTLRNQDGSSLASKTSIVYAMEKFSAIGPEERVDSIIAPVPLELSKSFTALLQAYENVKQTIKLFPHKLEMTQTSVCNHEGSWGAVTNQVKIIEQALRNFIRIEGHKFLSPSSRECQNEKVTTTLCRIRKTIHFLRYQAIHAKTLQKKLTVLRLEKSRTDNVSSEVKTENYVVMDGKYPRRTVESAEYSPWSLRPPHLTSER